MVALTGVRIATRLWLAIATSIAIVLGIGAFLRVRAEQVLLIESTTQNRYFFGRVLATVLQNTPDPLASERALQSDESLRRSHIEVTISSEGAEPLWIRSAPAPTRTSFAQGHVVVVSEGARVRTAVPVMHGSRRTVIEFDEPLILHPALARLALIASVFQALALASIAGVLAWLLVRRLLAKPLGRIVEHARRIGRGELDTRTEVDDDDEVSVLAIEMNAMATKLSEARAALEEAMIERATLQESLRHGDRLRTVGQLSAAIAHEVGTPLNTVLGHARMIEKRTGPDEQAHKSAAIIVEQAQRMSELIRGLLDFGRKKSSVRTAQDLIPIIERTWSLLEPIARKSGVEFRLEAAGPVLASVNASQILQVLTNLVMNSLQAMPQGGVVKVRASIQTAMAPRDVTFRASRYVCISVQDQGIGISQVDLQRVFEPFFTSKGEGAVEGTGLGLPVAQGIVKAHDGWIEITSQVDRGTTVNVFIPAID
jgi:two-component system NtrC family sensor kinase